MSAVRWVWTPQAGIEPPDRRDIGGKGHQLACLAALAAGVGARVPRFVIVRAAAFERWREAVPAESPDAFPDELAGEIERALEGAGLAAGRLAVRSSASDEDGGDASFAGQFESVLGVPANPPAALHAAIRRVWASAAGDRAVSYRARQAADAGVRADAGAGAAVPRMAVVLQEMVEPWTSGVAFAVDPVSGDTAIAVVSAVYGLGEGLVSGELDADTWHVPSGDGAPRRSVAHKDRAVRGLPGGGTAFEPVGSELAGAPALSDEEVLRVAACARAISAALGAPQDIEWALVDEAAGRDLVLLQTRPITTLRRPEGDPSRAGRRVWDNSNIIESYSGVTTPLTFTFARGVYEDVYRQFCRLMGVSEDLIAGSDDMFSHMLGLVRGRVYYNLINWYRLIALLPGFAWNRAFMERMMGVREALEAPPPTPASGSRLVDLLRLLRMLLRMVREYRRLGAEVPAFHARVRSGLAPVEGEDLSSWSESRIAALYRRLEDELLHHWRPPLVNDFFAMIFFGVLGRLIERWLPGSPATLANDLLCGEGGIISTEPARRVMALARQVRESPALAAVFAAEPDDLRLWQRVTKDAAHAPFGAALTGYVGVFGDRCLEELKLETVTLREDPTFLLRMVRAYSLQGANDPDAASERERSIRRDAEREVNARLHGFRGAVFQWVLRGARARVRDRENLRFERTRVFGLVRRMVLGMGAGFARRGRIDEARDVFWMTIEEVLGEAEGSTATPDPRPLIAARRQDFARWSAAPAPPERFETHGPLAAWAGPRDDEVPGAAASVASEGDLCGTGCCPGVVRAPVRIVRDPREAVDLAGRILVAERTDPGWTLLFPAAAGLLVQRGSLLSHSAIVAREMGLPCVVGIAGLLDTLKDGETVEMDGTSGLVRRPGAAA